MMLGGSSNLNFTAFPSGGPTQLSTTNNGEETLTDLRGTQSPLGGISTLNYSSTPEPNYMFGLNMATAGKFRGANDVPIREAKEDQETSHQRLHAGQSIGYKWGSIGAQSDSLSGNSFHRQHCHKIQKMMEAQAKDIEMKKQSLIMIKKK